MAMLVSIDNGGTLTDICVCAGSQMWHIKTLTTPHDLEPVPVRRAGQGGRPPRLPRGGRRARADGGEARETPGQA